MTHKWKKFQFVTRYDTYDPDTSSPSVLSTRTWNGGVNYFVHGHDLKLQLHFARAKTGDVGHHRVIARLQAMF